jgi:hypothetical protein
MKITENTEKRELVGKLLASKYIDFNQALLLLAIEDYYPSFGPWITFPWTLVSSENKESTYTSNITEPFKVAI